MLGDAAVLACPALRHRRDTAVPWHRSPRRAPYPLAASLLQPLLLLFFLHFLLLLLFFLLLLFLLFLRVGDGGDTPGLTPRLWQLLALHQDLPLQLLQDEGPSSGRAGDMGTPRQVGWPHLWGREVVGVLPVQRLCQQHVPEDGLHVPGHGGLLLQPAVVLQREDDGVGRLLGTGTGTSSAEHPAPSTCPGAASAGLTLKA